MSVRNYLYRNLWSFAIAAGVLLGSTLATSHLATQTGDPSRRAGGRQSPNDSAPLSPRRKGHERGPRAVAVVEWQTDARGRAIPKLVPVAILDDGHFYDASIYRATPIPMALESGTVYEAQDEGEILGYFTVKGAGRATAKGSTDTGANEDDRPWFGIGDWKTASPRLDLYNNRSQHAEVVRPGTASISGPLLSDVTGSGDSVDDRHQNKERTTVYNEEGKEEPQDANDGRPTLKSRNAADKSKEGTPRVAPSNTSSKTKNPADDPDRPRLKRQTSSDSSAGAQSTTSVSSQSPAAAAKQGSDENVAAKAPATSQTSDPDRPVLRRGKGPEQVKADAAPGGPVAKRGASGVGSTKAGNNKPASIDTVPQRVIDRGTREPDDAKSVSLRTRTYEAVAVSDAYVVENSPVFRRRWEGDEEHEVTQKMTALAESEIQSFLHEQASGIQSSPVRRTTGTSSVPKTQRRSEAGARKGAAQMGSKAGSTMPKLEEVRVTALDLNSNNSADAVFTARQRQSSPGNRVVYITLVARMDLSGNPRILFSNVTSSGRLDSVPRLEFIDAVDADGDGRAELLFRAVRDNDADFVIYRAGPDKLTEIFHGGDAS